jgi:hypothetical protein
MDESIQVYVLEIFESEAGGVAGKRREGRKEGWSVVVARPLWIL